MENMMFYEAGRAVPVEAQKEFSNGRFSGTDINPMWRIKKMTELFGPCGIGWYYEVLSERCEEHGDNDTIAIVDLNLYIKVDGECSKPIYGTGGNVIKRMIRKPGKEDRIDVSDEGYKMALTDALSVACKALGIGADIYFKADKTKYTAAPVKTLKTLMETAVSVYGKDMAPSRFGALMEKAGCTRETMNERYYDTIYGWMMKDKKGA